MHRIWLAFINSMRALRYLARHEKAVQQELALLAISIPVAFYIAPDALMFMLMVGAILFLLMIEVLNTGIEAACNALSREFHRDIQIAKDCGSLAVLISIILAAGVWGYALFTAIYL
ncbi:diacylglycerol kinase [Brucella endophytica]|uniref:Diacylglycerol kinase n=1 Tax=Brucella endophytica TaxID=1963359 RepID=A0A916S4F9_9HYPH|nr:diacylglycerol kinase [Brucella endophytica]GGA84025.1 diacylglycerol kinase [Brucella endophytica]